MTSLRSTACAVCQKELEPAQGLRCQVCRPDYEVCTPCYSKGIINHPHILITRRPSATTDSVVPNQIHAAQLRAVLLHIMTCCTGTKQCHYPMCRTVKLLMNHGITCKNRICNRCKEMWDLFRMHASSCLDTQCSIPKCREFKALFSRRNQQKTVSRRRAATSTPDSSTT